MDELVERLRVFWDNLNERERRLLTALGVVFAVLALCFPLLWIADYNSTIEEENAEYRSMLDRLQREGGHLKQLMEARKASAALYKRKTPALGSFLEAQASKQNLKLQEVTDQPEKAVGTYLRRNVRAGIPDVDLTSAVNLLSGIAASGYPVAIDHLQIEHYKSGDVYNLKLGVLTFDKKAKTKSDAKKKDEE
jgi:hypothetical protein